MPITYNFAHPVYPSHEVFPQSLLLLLLLLLLLRLKMPHSELWRLMIVFCILPSIRNLLCITLLRPRTSLKGHVCPLVGWYVQYANLKPAQISPFQLLFMPSRFHFHPVVYSCIHSFISSFIENRLFILSKAHALVMSFPCLLHAIVTL